MESGISKLLIAEVYVLNVRCYIDHIHIYIHSIHAFSCGMQRVGSPTEWQGGIPSANHFTVRGSVHMYHWICSIRGKFTSMFR